MSMTRYADAIAEAYDRLDGVGYECSAHEAGSLHDARSPELSWYEILGYREKAMCRLTGVMRTPPKFRFSRNVGASTHRAQVRS
jgi:hypothetical protein